MTSGSQSRLAVSGGTPSWPALQSPQQHQAAGPLALAKDFQLNRRYSRVYLACNPALRTSTDKAALECTSLAA